MFIIKILWQSISSRMAGGGICKHPSGLGELLFAIPIALAACLAHPVWWVYPLALSWSFLWFQTGHAVAFHMGAMPETAQSGRKAVLSHVIDPLCRAFRQPLGGSFYCWTFMGLKGFLIHLPLGLTHALAAAVLWPLAYWIGNRFIPLVAATVDGERVAEFLSGAFSGVILSF